MKCFLAIALITVCLLALFCSSGSALKCYTCSTFPCNTNKTCLPDQDACMKVDLVSRIERTCWKYSECDVDIVAKYYGVQNLKLSCCQRDLCNGSPMIGGSKLVLGLASLLAVFQMLSF